MIHYTAKSFTNNKKDKEDPHQSRSHRKGSTSTKRRRKPEAILFEGIPAEESHAAHQTDALVPFFPDRSQLHVAAAINSPYEDAFVERFIDHFAPPASASELEVGRADAIRHAGELREFSTVLRSAFQAASAAFVGRGYDDPRVVMAGRQKYVRVLSQIQEWLLHPERSRSEGLLAAIAVCTAYETLVHTTPEAVLIHCRGTLQLIKYRGPYSHREGVAHSIFCEMLPYWVAVAITMRQPTFLAEDKWKTVPWSYDQGPKDIMASLLEHVVDLPGILHNSDVLSSGRLPVHERSGFEEAHFQAVTDLESRLRRWKEERVDEYPPGQPFEQDLAGPDPFPVFQTIDPRTREIVEPPTIVYPDPQLCRTLCLLYAVLIMLYTAHPRPKPSTPLMQFSLACTIAQSMKYYIGSVPGNHMTRMVFPLSVAHAVFPAGTPGRDFVAAVSELIRTSRTVSLKPLLDDTVTTLKIR